MSAGRGAWRMLSGPLGAVLGIGLVALLVWRIAVAGFGGGDERVEPPPARKDKSEKPGGVEKGGQSREGVVRIYNKETGLLEISVHFGEATLQGETLTMKRVELKRVLEGDKGVLLASSSEGTYERNSGSGTLSGNVLIQRVPPGRQEPDMTMTADSLVWDQAAGTLTGSGAASMTWTDPKTGRKLVVRGAGLRAERWAETVRLDRDVCVTMVESAMPRLPLAGKLGRKPPSESGRKDGGAEDKEPKDAPQGPAFTTITCSGAATFENRAELGLRRVVFDRDVRARRLSEELCCNRLVLLLNPVGGADAREGADIVALTRASAAPTAGALAARCLARALAAPPPEPAKAGDRKDRPEQELLDSVLATGAVIIKGPEGMARGELAYFDRPGGCVWLDGGPDEPAEVMRGENQLVSQSFHFNLRTEEMSSEGRGRARVEVKGDVKLPGGR